jgi:hypothetical protein
MYDRIAHERSKKMLASKGKPKPFVLQHCWKLLEHSEKLRLRDQETPPKKGVFITLDDSDDSDEPNGRNKGKPDGRKTEKDKDKAMKRVEAASLREQIGKLMKSNDTLIGKQLEAKWPWLIRNNNLRRQSGKPSRKMKSARPPMRSEKSFSRRQGKGRHDRRREPGHDDGSGMDPFRTEFSDMQRMAVMQQRKQEFGGAMAGVGATAGGCHGPSVGGGDCCSSGSSAMSDGGENAPGDGLGDMVLLDLIIS